MYVKQAQDIVGELKLMLMPVGGAAEAQVGCWDADSVPQ